MRLLTTNNILKVAILVSLATYLFWDLMPKGSFFIGNAIFITLLAIYIYINKKNFVTFVLISFAINNLYDELFGNSTELGVNEILTAIFIVIYGFIKYKR